MTEVYGDLLFKHLNEEVVLGSEPPDNWNLINVNIVNYQTKTARQQDNFGAGSWRQDSASPFSQCMEKLVTGYRMPKKNYLE